MFLITIVHKETQEETLVYADSVDQFKSIFDYVVDHDFDIKLVESKTIVVGLSGLLDLL